MAHFYLLESLMTASAGDVVVLDGSEGKHAATVSRVRVGEELLIGNTRGLVVRAVADEVSKDTVRLSVQHVMQHENQTPALTLVQALAKTDRDERAIESATELGVDTVIPWAAARSVSKWEGAKVEKGVLRWTSIVREASKQSIRPFVPRVVHPASSAQLMGLLEGHQVLVLDPTAEVLLGSIALSDKNIAVVVGPEGGITPTELENFVSSGATLVSLGSNILRTSSAGPAALAILNSKLGRS